jgi:prepilin-type N-terminal cleavage/methylation domain-containing protein
VREEQQRMRIDLHRARGGFTIIEVMIVVAIVGIFAAFAVPSWQRYQRNLQVRAAARSVANAFAIARSRAITSGNRHIVAFAVDPGNPNDACGNAITDVKGGPAPLVVFDDGDSAAADCCFDAAEIVVSERAQPGVSWGVTLAGGPTPSDIGGGDYKTGSSFTEPDGSDAAWVAFGPDGIPTAFNAACNFGGTGTGAGAIYITNGDRDYGVVLNALGTSTVERYDPAAAQWEN